MKILNHKEIEQKINRLAIKIYENNYEADSIYLAGINNNGYHFANLLRNRLVSQNYMKVELLQLSLNPKYPIENPIKLSNEVSHLTDARIIIVDDVANTGRTIFYALKPLMEVLPHKIEVAVLVDRKHKSFPIQVDYVGLSLATTLKNNIQVEIRDVAEMAVYLS